MVYQDNTYIRARDLSFAGVLHDIKKSKTALQPVFEAFTNSLEAIRVRARINNGFVGEIKLKIQVVGDMFEQHEFASLTIEDNGIGFTEEDFIRFNTFKDSGKGFKNLGSGRIQYVHYFDNTTVRSVFQENDKFYEREFIVSKKKSFLDQNSIVYNKYTKESAQHETGTSITFNTLLENSNIYNSLSDQTMKGHLLRRYIHYFCQNRMSLPKIEIEFYVQSKLKGKDSISAVDLPKIDKSKDISLPYKKISNDGKIETLGKSEVFRIDAFKVSKDVLDSNDLKLVSKGEIVEESGVMLQSLSKSDQIYGYRHLFLVSSEYIDERDSNIRGELNIPSIDSFSKNPSLFSHDEIFIEDIQDGVNTGIYSLYPEIQKVKEKHDQDLAELKKMFLIDEETIEGIEISVNDTESKILEKFYEAEAKKVAGLDASIKCAVDNLNKLDVNDPTYNDELFKEVDRLVNAIPLQNKKTLAHYVARRKLILDLFEKILSQHLDIQKEKGIDEALIHNLLFQKGSNDPSNSDLWIVNEDFIYFKGSSEKQLSKVEIDGKRIFKEKFTEEEERYLKSLGENRKIKRPDVLIFPDEGKCIIIEFKAPEVNASDHLTQIDKYANFILNYTEEGFLFNTFYGYLLGENIEERDVRAAVTGYQHSYHFDYLFRPASTVAGFDGKKDGSIYTEVIKYSTLLKRARVRNKIFMEKLKI